MFKKVIQHYTFNSIKRAGLICAGLAVWLQLSQLADADQTNAFTKQLKTGWIEHTNTILGIPSPSPESKEAVYVANYRNNNSMEVEVIAIKNPKTGNIWLGRRQDFYLETDSKFMGGTLTPRIIQWSESLVPASTKHNLDSAIEFFEKKIDGPTLASTSKGPDSDLRTVLKRRFFTRRGDTDSETVKIIIKSIEVKKGSIQIDLENTVTHSRANVWIDTATWRPTKAIEHDEEFQAK